MCERKLLRRYLERRVDTVLVVPVDGAMDLEDKLAQGREAIRIAEINLELRVE